MGRHLLKLGEYIYSGYSWTKLILGCSLKSAGIHACLVTPSIRSVKPAHNSCSNKLSATLQCHYHLRKFPDKIKRGVDTPYQISRSHLCLYPHFRNNFLTQVEATLQITVTPKRYMNENNFFSTLPISTLWKQRKEPDHGQYSRSCKEKMTVTLSFSTDVTSKLKSTKNIPI